MLNNITTKPATPNTFLIGSPPHPTKIKNANAKNTAWTTMSKPETTPKTVWAVRLSTKNLLMSMISRLTVPGPQTRSAEVMVSSSVIACSFCSTL